MKETPQRVISGDVGVYGRSRRGELKTAYILIVELAPT